MLKEFATGIIRILRENGHKAYLVGGCVRDLLMGREPADYDVSTDATPGEVIQIFPETYAVGEQFGVVLVPHSDRFVADISNHGLEEDFPNGRGANVVEVATFRSDHGYTDGRHPDVVLFGNDPREDVERRDFTINGMMLDPANNEVLDFVGGQQDLAAGLIRSIGDPARRFAEDKLRMLRAARFAARFKFAIEPVTFDAMRALAPQIHQVSRDRVREELTKMLTEGAAHRAFLELDRSALLREVLPEIDAMKGVAQPPQYHPEGDVFVHTLLLLENLPTPCPPTLAWGALLHDVGKPPTFRAGPDRIRFDGHVEVGVRMAEEICRRLHFSNSDTWQILALVQHHMRFGQVQLMKDSTFKKFVRMPRFSEHLELHRMDCLSCHGDLSGYNFTGNKMGSIPEEAMRPLPLITGDDLIGLGLRPGPRFKEIISSVEDGQLDGALGNREEAMQFVRREFIEAKAKRPDEETIVKLPGDVKSV